MEMMSYRRGVQQMIPHNLKKQAKKHRLKTPKSCLKLTKKVGSLGRQRQKEKGKSKKKGKSSKQNVFCLFYPRPSF